MPDASSRVTVRRRRGLTGSLAPSFAVLLDGEKVGKVRRGGVLAVDVAPGPHFLAVRAMGEGSEELFFDAEPGRELTFECGFGATSGGEGILHGGLMVVAGSFSMNKLWVRRVFEETGDVAVTVPAWYLQDYSEAEIKKAAAKSGFKSAALNADGSVTYSLTEGPRQKKLAEVLEAVNDVILMAQSFLDDTASTSFRGIHWSVDGTEFTMEVDGSTFDRSMPTWIARVHKSPSDRSLPTFLDPLDLFDLVTQYQFMSGVPPEENSVVISIVDAETGDVLDVVATAECQTAVEVTVPAAYYEEGITEADVREIAVGMGAESAVLNLDRSVTYRLSQMKHRGLLAAAKAHAGKEMGLMLQSDWEIPSFREIAYNDDMSEFLVELDTSKRSEREEAAALRLQQFGCYYQALSGVAPERNRVVVSFVDAETGTVLETFDRPRPRRRGGTAGGAAAARAPARWTVAQWLQLPGAPQMALDLDEYGGRGDAVSDSNDLKAHEASGPTTTAGEEDEGAADGLTADAEVTEAGPGADDPWRPADADRPPGSPPDQETVDDAYEEFLRRFEQGPDEDASS